MGAVRITSGRLRGRRVQTPAGKGTRPLLTRVRKSLADLLRPALPGARVLDLFGGSGAISFELLSNGAASALAVELDARTAALLRDNARALGLEEAVEVRRGDALEAIPRLSEEGRRFDLVVVAPPYGRGLHERVLRLLGTHPLLAPGGRIVVQRETREPSAEPPPGLSRGGSRAYGRTVFDFYARDAG